MERKALPLADSGIMPVSGNKEPGVLSRKSSNSLFPYKKRYSVLYPHAPIHPSRNVGDLVKPALAEKLADQEAIGTAKVSVKNEVVPKQGESHSKLEFLADTGHIELSFGPKKLHVSSLVDSNTTPSCLMRGTVNPSLLSPSLNNNDADDAARSNRFNWDLNIPLDLWEAAGDDVPLQDASQIVSKPPSNSASVIGSNGDKGKQVVGASEQEFNFPISSIHPALRHKSANVLRGSLGSTLRGFDSSVLQSKSELVEEALLHANAGTAVHPAGIFEANVVKTEAVRQNLQSIELSSKELLEQEPMKCEPFMRSDVIAPQSVRRDLQLQESSSTCSDLSVSGGDLPTPSEYFDHTNDLKELNVCSDKVEASASASMNIEDHMVYRKTQDTHNLVASGEGLANDGEKISISAGTEEECYASDGYKAFAGHDDTEGVECVREDEECEDGEIREPLMQSIAEDPNAEGMDSGKNNESSSKNVQNVAVFRPVTGSSLPSRSGRERYFYMEEEKFHLQRNRDEIYGYGPKFVRDRFQDRPFGRSRGNFVRGRGRGWGWGRGRGQGRYSGRDFESYDNRHKHTAAFWESANERKDYDNRLDGGAIASNRRRDPLNDPLHSFRHPPAHGLSPNGREDAAVMDINPRRCPGEDGSAYVGVRHSRPDHHFGQGDNTKFTAMQRSGFPRMWSKSPVRSRTWSLPPRTLTEGLNGRQNLSQHRSPVMYREDRMRSSSRTSFTEEAIAPQRRDPSSYTARQNDMRDVDDVQEYGHPRSLSSRGSPPDQVFTRTNRQRVEMLDHQKRAYGDGYFDEPIHTGGFPELHSGERRKYGERQMRNVKEQEGGNVRPRHEEEFDGSRLKKRRF